MLTQDFKNAPIPSKVPPPPFFGIHVDKTPLGDVVDETATDPVREFLDRSFDFRCQSEMLGIVTSFHEQLAYHMNTIDSPGLNYLADIHDYLIDSAKNGYSYSYEEYQSFVEGCTAITPKKPSQPAYKQLTKAKMELPSSSRRQTPSKPSIQYNPDHATDKILFEVVKPHIDETLQRVHEYLANAQTEDNDLTFMHSQYRDWAKANGDEGLLLELNHLSQKLMELRNRFINERRSKEVDMDNFDEYLNHSERFFQAYQNITPTSRDRLPQELDFKLFLQLGTKHPTDWDLLKASTLYANCHKAQSYVFQNAGKELAELKSAASPSGRRNLVQEMWGIMKPRKAKKLEAGAVGAGLQDDDDAKSEGVAESIIDDM